jgi:micrococcal nuclease
MPKRLPRFALALLLLAPLPSYAGGPTLAQVERVVDGDTVVVNLEGKSVKVRLIGVDAPESVDPRKPVERFGHESADFLRRLVGGPSPVIGPITSGKIRMRTLLLYHLHQYTKYPGDGWFPGSQTSKSCLPMRPSLAAN